MARPTELESKALMDHAENEGYWFRAKEEIVRDFLRPHVFSRSSILILGVGNAATSRRLRELAPECLITGLDIDPAAIETASKVDPLGRYRLGDIEFMDNFAEERSLDVAICLDVLEHLEDDLGCARKTFNALKPGGIFAVNVPAHPVLFSQHDVNVGHVRRYRPREIDAVLRRAGFNIQHSTPLFASTLFMVILWRLIVQKFFRIGLERSDVNLRLPDWLDHLLYRLTKFEAKLARRRLPIGSSQFVLAQRPS